MLIVQFPGQLRLAELPLSRSMTCTHQLILGMVASNSPLENLQNEMQLLGSSTLILLCLNVPSAALS